MVNLWQEVLGVQLIGIHDNFFELGGDSLLAIQFIAKAQSRAGIHVTPRQLFEKQTVAELALVIGSVSPLVEAEQEMILGNVALTPIQHWFFEYRLANPNYWNLAVQLEFVNPMDWNLLETALHQLLIHHDALRLRFKQTESGMEQYFSDETELKLSRIDLSHLPETEQKAAMKAAAARLHGGLDIVDGPVLQVAAFDLGPHNRDWLMIVAHHLVLDVFSFGILIEGLHLAYTQLASGRSVNLPPKTNSYRQWSERLTEYAHSPELEEELAYWLETLPASVAALPRDFASGLNIERTSQTVTVTLSLDETDVLLRKLPAGGEARIQEAMLAALLHASNQWSGARSLLVDLVSHGREETLLDLDVSGTVGWFSATYPTYLQLKDEPSLKTTARRIAAEFRRIPQRGLGYGLLRYLRSDLRPAEQLRALPRAEITFNYLGQINQRWGEQSWLRLAAELPGPLFDPDNERLYVLYVIAAVRDGQLSVEFNYSENLHRRSTIERLAQSFATALQDMTR